MRKTGTSRSDLLQGTNGKDVLRGKGGNDALDGRDGRDKLYGDGGADVMFGAGGDDFLWGGGGIDALYGGAGNDKLRGGGGVDVLLGGEGRDVLWGGKGADSFLVADTDAVDIVKDFSRADQIVLVGGAFFPDLQGTTRKDVSIKDTGRFDLIQVDGKTVLKVRGEVRMKDIELEMNAGPSIAEDLI